jgi:hypothetical protein
VAQCGGGPNIARLRDRAKLLLNSLPYRDAATGWSDPWRFDTAEDAARYLANAGFAEIGASIEPAPTTFANAGAFDEFVRTAVLRTHLDAIRDSGLRAAFMRDITALAAGDDPPFTLDYWRLNLAARRPL